MITRFLNHESRTVEAGAVVIALTGVVSGALGILRNALLASKFGASLELDVYFAAFRIPDFIYSILIFGTLTAGFMPVFNKRLMSGKEGAWELASGMMNVFVIVLGVFAVLVAIFANQIVGFIAPGLSVEYSGLLVGLLRIMMIQPAVLAVSNIITASLQSFKRFFVSSLAPIFYNLGILIGVLWFVDVWGISGLAWGVVLGAVMHLAVQIPAFYSLGFKWSGGIRSAWPGICEIFTLTVPRMVNLLIFHSSLIVIAAIALTLEGGTLSIFNFAADLAGFPLILFGMSFATAAFPALAKAWAGENMDEYRFIFSRTFSEMMFWVTAVAIFFLAFREPVVRLTLVFGAFGPEAYRNTVNALAIFLLGLPGQAGVVLLIRAFFAAGNASIPLFTAFIGAAITIITSFWFGRAFGAAGLALGLQLSGFVQTILLLWFLKRILGRIDGSGIFVSIRRALIIGISSGLVGQISWWLLDQKIAGDDFQATAIKFAASILPAGLIFLAGIFILRLRQVVTAPEEINQ